MFEVYKTASEFPVIYYHDSQYYRVKIHFDLSFTIITSQETQLFIVQVIQFLPIYLVALILISHKGLMDFQPKNNQYLLIEIYATKNPN